ncbi:MAG: MBL fold metallo-hydrolase [Acidobacteria bacterium]|nr:MAG: MBL fold metallo-hydrolase [Acidobacteriota bacterium]
MEEFFLKFGKFDLHLVSDGNFWLDGGAMFGVVPRILWEKKTTADEKNRIRLGLNCLLVRTGSHNVLIDTGCGEKYTEKEVRIYRIEHDVTLQGQLARLGLTTSDIDIVLNTHFHFDHCGGNTCCDGNLIVPTFPKAEYVVRAEEYEDASVPNERSAASYYEHNWAVLRQRHMLRLAEEDEEILPGIRLLHTPGHTRGHQSVLIESEGRSLLFMADLCPTSAHIPLPWIMAYDLYPMTTLEVRKDIYQRAVAGNWLLLFEHDPHQPAGYLQEAEGKYLLAPFAWQD